MPFLRPWSWLVAALLAASVGCSTAPPADAHPPAPSTPTPSPTPATLRPGAASTRGTTPGSTYGFYAPYGRPTSSVVPVPDGFEPFYLQDVGRHGSRATVSSKPVKRVRALCRAAASDGGLTPLGADFCTDAQSLGDAMHRLGYGDLSPLGEAEWQEVGERTARDYSSFFVAAAQADAPIRFSSSKSGRAKDSSKAFREGIVKGTPGLELQLTKRTTTNHLLHFSTPLTEQAREEINRVEEAPATRAAARDVLRRLFGDDAGSLKDARAVWQLYAIAPGMGRDLDRYLRPADAEQLAALDDADTFYRYGPGAEGNDAFRSAAELRADILRVMERHLEGSATMGTFRHGHAETVVPLAALLRLGPSNRPVPPGTSAWQNGWLGSENAKMGANIDIAAYKKGGTVLVTVRYNERPTTILDCPSSAYGSYFYDFETLQRCWS